MIDYSLGQIVKSKAGRDKGEIFLIVSTDNESVYLVDGKKRKIEKPKQKNLKHIQPTGYICKSIAKKFELSEKISNSDIRKAIEEYLKNDE